MAWVRLDDLYADHQKVTDVGPLGSAMQVAAICYSNRHLTDGFISVAVAKKLIDLDGIAFVCEEVSRDDPHQVVAFRAVWTVIVEKLVAAGMWVEVEGGWRIHDYLDYQKTRAEIVAKRADPQEVSAARRESGRRGGQAKAANASKRASILPEVATDLPLANPSKIVAKSSIPNPVPNPNPVPPPDPIPGERARNVISLVARAGGDEDARARAAWLDRTFEEFADAYRPEKRPGDDARAIWPLSCADEAAFAAIMAGLERWKASAQWVKDSAQYVTNPVKWLQQRMFEQHPAPYVAARATGRINQMAEVEAAKESIRARHGVSKLMAPADAIDAQFRVAGARHGR